MYLILSLRKNICFLTNYSYCRINFSTSALQYKFNAKQISKLSLKFLKKEPAYRKKAKEIPSPSTSLNKQLQTEFSSDWRHQRVNKLLLEQVTEIIATSDICYQVKGKALEITKVQYGFPSIQVFWYTSSSGYVEELSYILQNASSFIRTELCNQRTFGRVPPIVFVRDEIQRVSQEIDKLLQKADVQELELLGSRDSLPPDKLEELDEAKNLTENKVEPKENELANFWPLRDDVFGVKRKRIMDMVKRQISLLKRRTTPDQPPEVFSDIVTNQEMKRMSEGPSSHERVAHIRKWVQQYKRSLKDTRNKRARQIESISYVNPDHDQDFEDKDEIDFMVDDDYTQDLEIYDYQLPPEDSDDRRS